MSFLKPFLAQYFIPNSSLKLAYSSLVVLLATPTVAAETHPSQPLLLDWQPQSATTDDYCPGYYLPYQPPALNPNISATQQPLYSNADASEYEQGVTHLKGNVELHQGLQQITGDYARFDNNERQVDVVGHVKYRRHNMIMQSASASFDIESSEAQLSQAHLAIPKNELRGNAASIDYHSNETVTMSQGKLTFCPPGNNAWAIHSKKIDLDPSKGFGEAQHAILKLGSVPVFYLPWMSFPIDDQRRSGFLFPTLIQSSQMGVDITTPYYLNIAPNSDAVITPRFTEFGGTILGSKIRHINANSEQSLYFNWALDDPNSTQHRWLTEFNHKGQISPSLSSNIQIKRVSDENVFDDFGFSRTDSEIKAITSKAQVNYSGHNIWLSTASLSLITHQNLTTSTPAYDQLPHASLAGGKTTDYGSQPITTNYQLDLSHFTRDISGLAANNQLTGTRIHLQPSVSSSWTTDYSFIKPKLSLPITHYQLRNAPSPIRASKTRIVPQFELDVGLLLERDLHQGYSQTLEPRLYYAYAPYKSQNDVTIFDTSVNSKPFYQANRFSGYDRIADTNRITLGVDSQFLDAKGWQKAKLSITQIHYLSNRQVQLSTSAAANTETYSPINGHMSYQFNPYWSSSLNLDWDPRSGDLEATTASMKYQPTNNQIVDVKYTEKLNSTQQGEVSVIWPLSPQWTLIAKHKEDLRNQQLQDEILGIEYANCCWKGRLVSRHWLVDQTKGIEHGVFFELSLKGLGDSDKQLTSGNRVRMADFMKGITGYNERTQ